jgi:hypothetical protein
MPEHDATPTAAVTVELSGSLPGSFGDYELLEELARGGMGAVYRARQRSLNRVVALKMLLPGTSTSETGHARFQAEAEAIAELEHPNIVPIYEIGENAGRPFFSMKLLEGGTLAHKLRDTSKLALRELVAILVKVCRAVHFAHQRGILHRDLKPGNILLDSAGEPFVADFGLAKRLGAEEALTVTGAILGTPAYMAPEQTGGPGQGVTTLTDVYALGAILYECLTGAPPFSVGELHLVLARIRNEEPVPPSKRASQTPRDLELICLKCLAKEPGQRYASAQELADDLERWLRGEPIQIRAPGVVSRCLLWLRSNSRAATWLVLIGLVWGALGPLLPRAVARYTSMMERMESIKLTMEQVPQIPRPWIFQQDPTFLTWMFWLTLPVAIVLHLAVGMLIYLASRSGDRWSHLGGAAAAGLIASVVAFIFYQGPHTVLAMAVVPTLEDLNALGSAYPTHDPVAGTELQNAHHAVDGPSEKTSRTTHPQDRLLERYPELAQVPEAERGNVLVARIVSKNVGGVLQGIALGVTLTLALALPLALGGAFLAGSLVDSRGSVRNAIAPYLETNAALSLGWLAILALCLALGGSFWAGSVVLEAVLTLLASVFAIVGVFRGWLVQYRVRCYVVTVAVIVLSRVLDVPGVYRWAIFAAFTPAFVLLLRAALRHEGNSGATLPQMIDPSLSGSGSPHTTPAGDTHTISHGFRSR